MTATAEMTRELTDAVAELNRWLDREHHRFPPHPLATSVAVVVSRLSTTQAELASAKSEVKASDRALSAAMEMLASLRTDHAEMVDGKVILSEAAFSELQAGLAAAEDALEKLHARFDGQFFDLGTFRARVIAAGKPKLPEDRLYALSNLVKEVESGT